jgi:hypothetical protein
MTAAQFHVICGDLELVSSWLISPSGSVTPGRICASCGAAFRPTSRHTTVRVQRFCSLACAGAARKRAA